MRAFSIFALIALLFLGLGLLTSCLDDDDDTTDDDVADDDTVDDDVADDDAADDDAVDDDVADDDAADDDATDDDDDATDDDDDATDDDDDATDDDDDSAILDIDFEDYNSGSLPSPLWTVITHGSGYMQVGNFSKEVTGKALFMNGGLFAGDDASAEVHLDSEVSGDIRVSFDVYSDGGTYANFIAYCSTGTAAFLDFRFDDGILGAYSYQNKKDKDSFITCSSSITESTHYHIDVDLFADGTYRVLLDSASTPCANMVNYYLPGDEYTSFKFAEGDDADMTGMTCFDNIFADYQ